MRTEATSPDATRHRLLEGVLLRLVRSPHAGDFILRGGMLLRHWFRPVPRPADDLDLITASPSTVEDVAARFLPALADRGVADGVAFDADRVRVEGIFLDTGSPGLRLYASGAADGNEVDFHIDISFGPAPRPEPVIAAIPTECGQTARVWVCRPEAVAGQKVQAILHLGMLGWRAKDLDDLRLLGSVPRDDDALRAACAAYLADIGGTVDDARAAFEPESWWGMKRSSARWLDFVKASKGRDVPRDLAAVVAGVAARLAPVLEGLP